MKTVVFYPHYNRKHQEVLRAMADGIPGALWAEAREIQPFDVAVVFGWYKTAFEASMAKKPIIQMALGNLMKKLVVVESGFMRRGEYYQVGLGGFAGNANFRADGMPMDRFEGMGFRLEPWKKRAAGPMVVVGQVFRDTQVQDTDHAAWCREMVRYYKQKKQHVLFRPHPKEEHPENYGVPRDLWDTRPLAEVLADARAVVTWNSTTGVEALVAGIPVVACNPGSMSWDMSSRPDEELKYPDRTSWAARLGYSQWTMDEMRKGLPWKHLFRP